jgi:hypothetical protein
VDVRRCLTSTSSVFIPSSSEYVVPLLLCPSKDTLLFADSYEIPGSRKSNLGSLSANLTAILFMYVVEMLGSGAKEHHVALGD